MNTSKNTSENTSKKDASYRLVVDGYLLELIHEATGLEDEYVHSEQYSDHRQDVEEQLNHLYEQIGFLVVYDIKGVPF